MEHPFQDASAAGPSSSHRNIQQYDGLDNANVGNDMAVEGNRDGAGSSDQGGLGNDELDTGPDSGSVGEQEALERCAAAHAEELHLCAAVLAALSERPPLPPGDSAGKEDEIPDTISQIENIKITQQFIEEICSATLDNSGLDPAVVEHLRNPEEGLVDISDPDV